MIDPFDPPTSPGRHEQVQVRVNASADRAVAPLVEALAQFDSLISVESCQGGEPDAPDAYVTFRVGETWRDLGCFLAWLSSALNDQPYRYRLSLVWNNGAFTPWAQIHVPPASVTPLAAAIRSVASRAS